MIKLLINEELNLKSIIKNVMLTDIRNAYTGPLWFLQSLIMLYLIFPVLKVVHDENKKIYNYFFIIVAIFTVGLNLINNILVIIQNIANIKIVEYFNTFFSKYNPIQNGSFIFFFMLGGYIFEKKEKLELRKNRIICIIIGIISIGLTFILEVMVSKTSNYMVSGSFNYGTIFTAAIIISLFALLYKYDDNKEHFYNKFLMDIGKNSLGIYLVHKIIITVLNIYVPIFKEHNMLNKVLLPICVLIISYMIVKIIQKIPKVRKIVEL